MEIKNWRQYFSLFVLLFVIYLIPRFTFNFPLTLIEAKESYSAYTLTTPQFWFPTDNNFISPIGVYLRMPFVKGGIDYLSVRLPTIALGFVVLLVFFTVALSFFKNKIYAFVISTLFSLTPVFVYSSVFEINVMAFLLVVLIAFFVLQHRSFSKKSLIIAGIGILLILPIGDFAFRHSIFYSAQPAQTSYIIDHKLSTGMLLKSPLVTTVFNFTRIAYNKAFFALEQITKNAVSRFDFEMIFSPKEASTIIQSHYLKGHRLPSFHIWELPFILFGLFIFIPKLSRVAKLLFLVLFAGWIIFDTSWMTFLVPFLVLAEASVLQKFWAEKRIIVLTIGIFYLSAVTMFLRKFADYKSWMNPVDIAQYEIWQKVTSEKATSNQIFVTDRIGESAYYYLAYHNVDPTVEKVTRPRLDQGLIRTEKIGNINFSSFEFDESKAQPRSIWIGKEQEFKKNIVHDELFGGLWFVCNQCQ